MCVVALADRSSTVTAADAASWIRCVIASLDLFSPSGAG